MRRVSRSVALAALALVAATACGRYLSAGAAVVNGVSISQDALAERVGGLTAQGGASPEQRLQLPREVLSQMIRDELVRQEIERRDLSVSADEVESTVQDIRGRFPSEEEFRSALEQQGFTPESLRERIRDDLLQQRLRDDLIKDEPIPSREIQLQYRQNRRSFEEISVRHILFSTEGGNDAAALREARSALARLRDGADFADLARRLSDDPGSGAEGGALGTVRRGRFVPEFESAAFRLRPGVVSDPVKSDFGYHLILVDERRVVPFAEAREEIRDQLQQEAGEAAFNEWQVKALNEAAVEVNPRYGDWDPQSNAIAPRQFFVPGEPETEPVLPENPFGQGGLNLVPQ